MSRILTSFVIAGAMTCGMQAIGCSEEVSHSEQDKPTWSGGTKHEETTTYRNPDGTISTEKKSSTTNPPY